MDLDAAERVADTPERRVWMKRKRGAVGVLAVAVAALAAWGAVSATAAPKQQKLTKVTLQLKWVTQAQFAGYYAALEKGYYKQAGLDVKIKVGGPSITPETVVVGKQARSEEHTSELQSPCN